MGRDFVLRLFKFNHLGNGMSFAEKVPRGSACPPAEPVRFGSMRCVEAHASDLGSGACRAVPQTSVTNIAGPGSSADVIEPFHLIHGGPDSDVLVVVDHASRDVPEDIDLGIDPLLAERHIGWDIGADGLGRALCGRLGCPGLFGGVSRLVLDLHREEHSPALIPLSSDGHVIPGNQGITAAAREARIARFWRPYHTKLAALVASVRPALIAAVHSFTPRLETSVGPDRPWQVGILYNQDDRAARIAITELRAMGFETGDNEPYSGKLLNATMNMHAEANGIPYLAIEVRNDLIRDRTGVDLWAGILQNVIVQCRNKLASEPELRT